MFTALSASTRALAAEAMQAARRHGTVVSYDLNFRASLWRHAEVLPAEVNRPLVQHADVVIGNEEDYATALGYPLEGVGPDHLNLDAAIYERMLARVVADFPGLTVAAATLRRVRTASVNDWSGVCHTPTSFHEGRWMPALEIFDRVGGGDSFVSGLAYGLLTDLDVDTALAFGIAHGALAMTTPGDTSMATLAEVRRLAAGRSARVIR